jgi:hypothetical protein
VESKYDTDKEFVPKPPKAISAFFDILALIILLTDITSISKPFGEGT